jgi:hypothetical protein
MSGKIVSAPAVESNLFVMDAADHVGRTKMQFEGGEAVKLSEFLYFYACKGNEITEQEYNQLNGFKIKNVVIFDKKDISILQTYNETKLDLSESIVAPEAVRELGSYLSDLRAHNYKVLEGSKIKFPPGILSSFATFDEFENAKKVCLEIGFQLV